MTDAATLEQLLDGILEVEFTFRNTASAADSIAGLPVNQQDYVIDWVRRVASTNTELGYQYACHAVQALSSMERQMVEAWALHAMDSYDREGLHPALEVIRQLDSFVQTSHERTAGCLLEERQGVLLGFLRGLSGRRLDLADAECGYTDSETIFLPPMMARLDTPKDNFLLYKVMITLLWAQTRYGTFSAGLADELTEAAATPGLLELFHAMESLRLEARIGRELPGLQREMQRLKRDLGEPDLPSEWDDLRNHLSASGTSAAQVLGTARQLLGRLEPYPPSACQGRLQPQAVAACMAARLQREKAKFRVSLKMIEDEQRKKAEVEEKPTAGQGRFSKRRQESPEPAEGMRTEILLDGKPVPVPVDVQSLMSSIILDLGDIPDDYLEPAGAGEYDPALWQEEQKDPDDVWSGVYHEQGAYIYHEWDYRRQHYHKNWCAVREKTVTPVHDGFAEQTVARYYGLVKHLRKTFEAMRDENRCLKRQTDGEEIDLDALVEALADARDGREMSDRLFARMHRTERNIAVVFMVDMSGSTKGWINDAERESLVLLCESLESLGDRYAIYGFSSITRKRCELYHIKRFDEPYEEEVKGRISGIQPKDYTRMGFAIRHLTTVLNAVDARTRILITLSDGKPDDYDSYRGEYGIEDTRRALLEARREGVHPYCITIDEEARDYLPHMYGPAAYTLVDDVRSLPLKVSDIYRRLTTK
jgi:nitric oxide reductase NorD protein